MSAGEIIAQDRITCETAIRTRDSAVFETVLDLLRWQLEAHLPMPEGSMLHINWYILKPEASDDG